MGEWFNQARFDLNDHSTKSLIEWAKDQVDTARLFARIDFPPRPPEDMLRTARDDIEHLFRDKPAAVVLNEAGQSRDAVLHALDTGKFEAVLSGLDQAIRYGSERELPAAAALAAPAIEAQARYTAAEQKLGDAINAGELRQVSADQLPSVRQNLVAATEHATAIMQGGASRKEAASAVDRVIDASRSYWETAADSGRNINNAAKATEAAAKQAAQPADNAANQATQGRGQGRAR
ncbi:MAG: hypothetical protein PHE83_16250 [Opitutaceae bacterium]|nr:hypothetical protein [Opitutaceae bacterium]